MLKSLKSLFAKPNEASASNRSVADDKVVSLETLAPESALPTEPRDWPQDQSALPWFDRDDAPDTIKTMAREGRITAEQKGLLEKWVEDGYFVIEGLIDKDRVQAFRDEIENIGSRQDPYAGLNFSDVKIGDEVHVHVPHEDLLALSLEEREKAKAVSNWRIGALHLFSEAANRVFLDDETRQLCELIFAKPSIPRYSLSFHKGSQQLLHQDTPVFHVFPRNHLIGVWIAMENITADSGPLVYFPKSHREPLYEEFGNYPQTNRRTCSQETSHRYDAYVQKLSERFEEKLFTPNEGDALFWHGQLIHGGYPVQNPDTTRLSFVVHHMAEGCDAGAHVVGPFNW
ncbi:MAG: phytanoyl-CoA dioxygenase family protein [Pseudomonadota bacterium]